MWMSKCECVFLIFLTCFPPSSPLNFLGWLANCKKGKWRRRPPNTLIASTSTNNDDDDGDDYYYCDVHTVKKGNQYFLLSLEVGFFSSVPLLCEKFFLLAFAFGRYFLLFMGFHLYSYVLNWIFSTLSCCCCCWIHTYPKDTSLKFRQPPTRPRQPQWQ